MTTAWAHLPNAGHIDRILAHVKAHPDKWTAGYDKKAWKAAWDAVRGVARDEAWVAARGAARDETWVAARGAIAALIAWDEAGDLFSQPIEVAKFLADEGNPTAILLYPAMVVMQENNQ